jgi:pyrroloquinoline quinone biosynthesis protein D
MIEKPLLVKHARYRWDRVRRQHQLVYPEGLLVLNETAAAIVQLCDGRSVTELNAELARRCTAPFPPADVDEFLARLAEKGLLRDAAHA